MNSRSPSPAPQNRPDASAGDPPPLPSVTSFYDKLRFAASKFFEAQGARLESLEVVNLTFTLEDVEYEKFTPKEEQPLFLEEKEYRNGTDALQSQEFGKEQTTTVSSEISVTRGFEVGGGLKFDIPQIGLGIDISAKASVETTKRQTVTTEQRWTWRSIVQVPPHTRVVARAVLTRAMYDLEFSAPMRISGDPFSCTASGTLTGHPFKLSFSPGRWFREVSVSGFTPDGDDVIVQVAGTMKDVQGIGTDITASQWPLDATDDEPPARTYSLPNTVSSEPSPGRAESPPAQGSGAA